MVTEQEYLPKLSSGSSSMLSASVYRHGSADMAVFMYSDGAEVGVRETLKKTSISGEIHASHELNG